MVNSLVGNAKRRLVISRAARAMACLENRLSISATAASIGAAASLVATASLAGLGTDSGSIATGAVHLDTRQNSRFRGSLTAAANRGRVAAVTPIRTAVARSIGVQAAAIGTRRSADTQSVAACATGLLGGYVPVQNIIRRKTTAATRAHELRRLRRVAGQLKETRKHEDAEEGHRQEWVDKHESQNRGEDDTFEDSETEETSVRERVATHLSEDVWRKRWDGTNTATDSILNLGFDFRVGVHSLENFALHLHVSMHATSESAKVLA